MTVNEVWYQFTATGETNDITINSSGLEDIVMVVDDTPCGDGAIAFCGNGAGGASVSQTINATLGATIYVSVASTTGTEGNFQICVDSYVSASSTAGDDCTVAFPYCDASSTFSIYDMSPFDGAPKPQCFTGPGSTPSQAAFITFTISETGTYRVDCESSS